MHVRRCLGRDDYLELVGGPDFTVRWMLENHLAATHAPGEGFVLAGFCTACLQPGDFAVTYDGAWTSPEGNAIPNWRESLRCPRCTLNGRQRMTAHQITRALVDAPDRSSLSAYMMEQVTPIFSWAESAFPHVEWTGSEYLGPDLPPGAEREGVRHEDAERLSFPDAAFDLVVSCDVLEHVNEPSLALAEIARVLRPGGTALLQFPMDPHLDRNRRRAQLHPDGSVEHLLEPIYHGNPLSPDGSLVFTDFGWEVLEQMRSAGLADTGLDVYWSCEHGWLGIQFYFLGHRDQPRRTGPRSWWRQLTRRR